MKKEANQAKLLRRAREQLKITSAELAERLGVKLGTLNQWLLPADAKAHRVMPLTARLLLARIMADKPKVKK